jgi:hypothetical protein
VVFCHLRVSDHLLGVGYLPVSGLAVEFVVGSVVGSVACHLLVVCHQEEPEVILTQEPSMFEQVDGM